MNIWKDIDKKRSTPDDFIAGSEIQQGDKTKYELDTDGLKIFDFQQQKALV